MMTCSWAKQRPSASGAMSPIPVRMKVMIRIPVSCFRSDKEPGLRRRSQHARMILHLRDDDRHRGADGPAVDVAVDVGPKGLEEMLPRMGRAAREDDDLGRVGVDGRD